MATRLQVADTDKYKGFFAENRIYFAKFPAS